MMLSCQVICDWRAACIISCCGQLAFRETRNTMKATNMARKVSSLAAKVLTTNVNVSEAPRESKKATAKRIAEEKAQAAVIAEAARIAELAKAEAKTKVAETKVAETKVKVQVVRDAFGNRLSTRAHAINAVLFAAADKGLKASEIETMVQTSELGRAYALANGKQIGGVRNHLQALLALKLVTLEKGVWTVVPEATKAQRLLERAAEAEALAKAAETK